GLPALLRLDGAAAAAGTAPRRLRAAGVRAGDVERRSAHRDHAGCRGGELDAVAAVAGADRDHLRRGRAVRAVVRGLAAPLTAAVAVGDGDHAAQALGRAHRGGEVAVVVRVGLDQDDVAGRADRRDHLDVEVDLLTPARVAGHAA